MTVYKKILVALELSEAEDQKLIQMAEELTQKPGVELYIVHAVEYFNNYTIIPSGIDFEQSLIDAAKKAIHTIGERLSLPEERQIVKEGSAKFVILDEAKNLKVDLIILGSHGRHGVRLLLGSTANAVLHSAHSDVLAVRVAE